MYTLKDMPSTLHIRNHIFKFSVSWSHSECAKTRNSSQIWLEHFWMLLLDNACSCLMYKQVARYHQFILWTDLVRLFWKYTPSIRLMYVLRTTEFKICWSLHCFQSDLITSLLSFQCLRVHKLAPNQIGFLWAKTNQVTRVLQEQYQSLWLAPFLLLKLDWI